MGRHQRDVDVAALLYWLAGVFHQFGGRRIRGFAPSWRMRAIQGKGSFGPFAAGRGCPRASLGAAARRGQPCRHGGGALRDEGQGLLRRRVDRREQMPPPSAGTSRPPMAETVAFLQRDDVARQIGGRRVLPGGGRAIASRPRLDGGGVRTMLDEELSAGSCRPLCHRGPSGPPPSLQSRDRRHGRHRRETASRWGAPTRWPPQRQTGRAAS